MSDKVEYWLKLAEYDMETARVMLSSGRYLYVGFMCHQVVEKALKGCYAKLVGGVPPKTHNLIQLASLTALDGKFSQKQNKLLAVLNSLNIENRYPSERKFLAISQTAKKCREYLADTEEMLKWIETTLSK